KLVPFFPGLKDDWTATQALPGGAVTHFNAFRDEMHKKYAKLGRELVEGVVRRHGNRTETVLGDARGLAELGRNFGAGLTEREIKYLRTVEWAMSAQDVLWRRTKCGLHMTDGERRAVEEFLGR
ncbi:MAG: glycerol-3-phosphate dehydrogenase C-terminal domain-containing protein, partial [Usitatibacter sp.]